MPIRAILCCTALAAMVCWAQQDAGTITGTVREATQAVVPGVAITATSVNTNISFTTTTNEAGLYTVPALRAGEYTVTAELKGFKKSARTGILLQVNHTAVVDFALEVGDLQQSVEIHAEPPLLETQNVTLGDVVEEREIRNLPLNGRNFVQLLTLTPGATPGVSTSSQAQGFLNTARGNTAVQINGQNDLSTNFLLDGIDNNETTLGGVVIFPPVDAIQEFKVQTAASSADFGRNGGGQVNVTLKSGTNEFHGDLFEFVRNSAFDAKNVFDLPNSPIPPFRMNQFGGTAGGPIRKNKTFIFGDYQGSRIIQAQTFTLTVPTAAMRNGDLHELPNTIYDPATYSPATNTRQQFPGNMIPASRLSSAAQTLSSIHYPLPNRPGISNNYTYTPNRWADTDAGDVKMDQQLTQKDYLFGRYSYSNFDMGDPFFATTTLPNSVYGNKTALNSDPTTILAHSAVLSDAHTFSPSLVNEARLGFTRFNAVSLNRLQDINAAELAGIHGVNNPGFAGTGGLPQIGVSGFSTIGEVSYLPFYSRINTFQYIDNLTYVKGRHTWKAGFDVRRRQFNFFQPPAQRGTFSFTGAFTNNPGAPAGTGSGYSDFLLGLPLSSSQSAKVNSFTGQRSTEWSWFVADNWKLTSRLTLDLGLRYELTTPRVEVADRQSNFDPSVPGGAFRVASPDAPCGRALRCTDYTNLAPRAGIAYQLNQRTTIRTAYGIFYDMVGVNGYQGTVFTLVQNPPFTTGQNIVNNATDPRTRLEDGFPPLGPVPVINGLVYPGSVPGLTFGGSYQEPNLRTPYVQNWHFTVERQVGSDLVFGAGYVGTKGTRVLENLGLNDPTPGPGAVQPRRPFPGFATINEQATAGSSSYNSLQLRAEKRYSHGLTLLAAYTWSKTLSDVFGQGSSKVQDAHNRAADRGPTSFDIPHRLVVSYNWDLPFGHQQRFLADAPTLVNKLVEGWRLGGIVSLQSGEPFSVMLATPVSNTGTFNRANRVCSGHLDHPTADHWFDTSCFVTPTPFTFGNSGVGILRGPGTHQFDLSLQKNIHIDEKRYFQFRAEAFNAFNTPQFNLPNASLGSPSFGRISSAGNKPNFIRTSRQIQLGLKFFW